MEVFLRVAALALGLAACHKAPPPGNPEFNDAIHQTFIAFDAPNVDLAFSMRALETAINGSMDVTSGNSNDRAMTPERLTDADVADLTHPDLPPGDALPVAVAGVSPYPPEAHQHIQMLADQTPVEPYSPDKYDRTFLAGEDCWIDIGCEELDTFNDLIKKNALMEVPYTFKKNFRWIDLNLPDPADVPAGEDPPTVSDHPRWSFVARSWQEVSGEGTGGHTAILQSYTVETWIPRETDGGTLRLLAVWSEADLGSLNPSDELVEGTTRVGIDNNFKAADDWLESNGF